MLYRVHEAPESKLLYERHSDGSVLFFGYIGKIDLICWRVDVFLRYRYTVDRVKFITVSILQSGPVFAVQPPLLIVFGNFRPITKDHFLGCNQIKPAELTTCMSPLNFLQCSFSKTVAKKSATASHGASHWP